MLQTKKTKYILELDAKEYATFIAILYSSNKETLKKYYYQILGEDIYDTLLVGKSTMIQTIENIYHKKDFIVSSDIINNILEGEELK